MKPDDEVLSPEEAGQLRNKYVTVTAASAPQRSDVGCSAWVADWRRRLDEARDIYLDALAESDRVKATLKAARSHWQRVEREYGTAKSATAKLNDSGPAGGA